MKKIFCLILVVFSLFTMVACGNTTETPGDKTPVVSGEKFVLPEIAGGSYVEAIVTINQGVELNPQKSCIYYSLATYTRILYAIRSQLYRARS